MAASVVDPVHARGAGKLRIAIDMAATQRPRLTGWERHLLELARRLRTTEEVELSELRMGRDSGGRVSTLLAQQRWYWHGLRRAAARARPALVHCAAFPPPPLPVPLVWTVHDDLIVGGHPEYARRGAKLWVPLGRRALGHVDAIITDTHVCKAELVAAGAAADTVHVIRPAAPRLPSVGREPLLKDTSGRLVGAPAEFLLCVGTLERRKRPDIAVQAAARAGLPIVLAGGEADGFKMPAEVLGPHVILAGRVTDEELAWLYRRASALISASEYEGFNYPMLEASLVGLPVAASAIDVHREVAPHAVFFTNTSVETAANAVLEAIHSRRPATPPEPMDPLRDHLDVYRGVLGQRGA